jgi:hypothetical protein
MLAASVAFSGRAIAVRIRRIAIPATTSSWAAREAGGKDAGSSPARVRSASSKSRAMIADWLSLAAAPTFAVMALLTGVFGGGAPDMLCSAAHGWPLGGMVPMYLLMSAFHLAPWLRLIGKPPRSAG